MSARPKKRLPKPLTPPGVDMAPFEYMPLNVAQLQRSETWAMASGDEAKAAMNLWMKAWQEVPAASLPNNEAVLATWSGSGPNWSEVRDVALRGFVLCSDGRLYHQKMAEKVIESLAKMRRQRHQTQAATSARKTRSSQRNDSRNGQRNDDRNDEVNGRRKVEDRIMESPAATSSTMPPARAREEQQQDFLDDEAKPIAERFLSLREELWPETMDPVATADQLARQAAEWLGAGMNAATLSAVIERKMHHASGPPNSLEAYAMALRNAMEGGNHSEGMGVRPANEEFLDPRLEELQLAWAKAAGDPERRGNLEKAMAARQAELDTTGGRAA